MVCLVGSAGSRVPRGDRQPGPRRRRPADDLRQRRQPDHRLGAADAVRPREAAGGAWNFNPVLPAPKAITSLAGATSFDLPASMVDLNADTAFTGRPAQSGDYVGVDLDIRRPIKTVEFVLGQDGAVQQGVVEYSGDGTGWTPLATVSGSPDVTVALPSGVTVQYV